MRFLSCRYVFGARQRRLSVVLLNEVGCLINAAVAVMISATIQLLAVILLTQISYSVPKNLK